MGNRCKRKGDRGELEAVAALVALTPAPFLHENPTRMLGAGRRDDEGDLRVLPGVSVQVKTWADLTRACRESAAGAARQAANAGNPFALGMVPIPRAGKRRGALRWLAVAHEWPGGTGQWEPVATFGRTVLAVAHLRDGYGGRVPLRLRMARVTVRGRRPLLLAPVEAWVADWVACERLPVGHGRAG